MKQFGSYLSASDGHACRPIAREGRTKGNGTALGKVGLDDRDDLLTLAGIPVAAACLLTPTASRCTALNQTQPEPKLCLGAVGGRDGGRPLLASPRTGALQTCERDGPC